MLRVNFILPYYELQDTVARLVAEYTGGEIHFDIQHVVGVEDARGLRLDADIVVARGITCQALRETQSEVPVVEIPVNAYDILLAIDECRRSFSASRIALIGAENMVAGVSRVAGLIDAELLCLPVAGEEEAREQIARAAEAGVQAIVGGLMVYNFAREAGVPCTWVKTGPDALKQAIEEAVRTARVKARERERAEFFKIVMDYTHEAILAVDRRGRVTALNRAASGILGVPAAEVLGEDIRGLLPETGLLAVMESAEEDIGALEQVGDTMIAANLVPMRIGDSVAGAVATFHNVARIQELEGRIRRKIATRAHASKYRFEDIACGSPAMAASIATARRYARIDAGVLITGETGTGKELVAHSLHTASARARAPFVAVNCAALPEALLESELFGYAEGAFTGATRGGKAGLFEAAHGGSIFLDEIGEIPLALQAKLLRVLQEREIMRVGDGRLIPVDVRVIAATNQDLRARAAAGAFRRDLLYRLDVLRVSLPPLRQRPEDILPLVEHFLRFFGERFGRPVPVIAAEGREVLTRHPWPGNVRQLMNLCERLVAAGDAEAIGAAAIAALMDEPARRAEPPAAAVAGGNGDLGTLERERVLSTLRAHGFRRAQAARALGISRATLWRKLKLWYPGAR